MSTEGVDITLCAREPIDIPGSIQPHGLMLVVNPENLCVTHAAGDVATRLGRADWLGAPLVALLGEKIAAEARRVAETRQPGALELVAPPLATESFGAQLHLAGTRLVVELEPKPEGPASPSLLPQLEAEASRQLRAGDFYLPVALGNVTGRSIGRSESLAPRAMRHEFRGAPRAIRTKLGA
jgi:light-regulated signal transduction histidine kinase (bacteriophytochrome)